MIEVARSPHVVVKHDPARSFVIVARTGAPLDGPRAVDEMVALVKLALDRLGRDRLAVLIDLREAPIRDETEQQERMSALRATVTRDVRASAFLVQTGVGMLQVRRFLREQGIAAPVFDDEGAALAHLTPQGRR